MASGPQRGDEASGSEDRLTRLGREWYEDVRRQDPEPERRKRDADAGEGAGFFDRLLRGGESGDGGDGGD